MIDQEELLFNENCIRTFTGKPIDVFNLTIDDICIEDIAHALSNECRWGGHCKEFYSVAQHSIFTSKCATQPNKLAALLHDASEAYLRDIPRPIKHRLPDYKKLEHYVQDIIAQKFGFEYPFNEEIKKWDDYALRQEWSDIVLKDKLICKSPTVAEKEFLQLFKTLTNGSIIQIPNKTSA